VPRDPCRVQVELPPCVSPPQAVELTESGGCHQQAQAAGLQALQAGPTSPFCSFSAFNDSPRTDLNSALSTLSDSIEVASNASGLAGRCAVSAPPAPFVRRQWDAVRPILL
jgi:hypothetical protein